MIDIPYLNILISTVFLVLTFIELIKGVLIIFKNKYPPLLMVQISLLILKALPGDHKARYKIIMDAYHKKIKKYGWFTILGAPLLIAAFIQIIIMNIK